MRATVDHLMWGAPDLDTAMVEAERLFGVVPVRGGAHPGLGTRNALVGLDAHRYLEIIAPDPTQPLTGTFGATLAALPQPALVTWALRVGSLPPVAGTLAAAGLQTRGPLRTRRSTPTGQLLEWELLFVRGHAYGGLFPFYIDWLQCPHPSAELPSAGSLDGLVLQTTNADTLRTLLGEVDVPLEFVERDRAALRATITTPRGPVVLTSSAATVGLRIG